MEKTFPCPGCSAAVALDALTCPACGASTAPVPPPWHARIPWLPLTAALLVGLALTFAALLVTSLPPARPAEPGPAQAPVAGAPLGEVRADVQPLVEDLVRLAAELRTAAGEPPRERLEAFAAFDRRLRRARSGATPAEASDALAEAQDAFDALPAAWAARDASAPAAAWRPGAAAAQPAAPVDPEPEAQTPAQAFADAARALRELTDEALRRPPATPVVAAAEGALSRGGDLRAELRDAVWAAAAADDRGAWERVLTDPRWVALAAARGYGSWTAVTAGVPGWEALAQALDQRRAEAIRFYALVSKVDQALGAGDLEAARARARAGAGLGGWFDALAAAVSGPDAAALLAPAQATEAAPAAATASRADWAARFLAAVGAFEDAGKAERDPARAALVALLEEAQAACRGDLDACVAVQEVLDPHQRLLRRDPPLEAARRPVDRAYFEAALARCAGPGAFHALDRWCKERGHDGWRQELAPFLGRFRVVGQEAAAREARRGRRAAAIEAVRRYSARRLGRLVEGLQELIAHLADAQFAPSEVRADLAGLITRAVEGSDPGAASALRASLAELAHAPREGRDPRGREHERRRERLVDRIVGESLDATERALAAQEPGLAFDLFQYVLLLDPQNGRAHKGLGNVRVEGRWLRRFAAERLRAGFRWDSRRAWVPRNGGEAAAAEGAVWDDGRFVPLDEANRRHADPERPWVVQTEHFELRSTADLHRVAWLAERLEAFYLAMFRQYDLFFAGPDGAAVVFGIAPQPKPLLVHVYRDRAQYLAHSGGRADSAGFYSRAAHASFFYDTGEEVAVLQHELTHQILGETAAGAAPSWLAEGAAVYLEAAAFRHGVLEVGGVEQNPDVAAYRRGVLAGGDEWTLRQVLDLATGDAWQAGGLSHKNYRAAGATVFFLCRFDGGRYRADFVEMLRDAYRGSLRSADVEAYFNLPLDVLEDMMRRFYEASGP